MLLVSANLWLTWPPCGHKSSHTLGDFPSPFRPALLLRLVPSSICALFPHVKSWLIGKDSDAGRDWGQEEKGMTGDEMAGWHHWLERCEFEWTPGYGDGQGGLECCASWDHKESDPTERLNWCTINQARILEWIAILLQGIFPSLESNPGLPHCRQIFYQLSHQGSPRILNWVADPFSRGSSQPRNRTGVSWIAGGFFTSWATREA